MSDDRPDMISDKAKPTCRLVRAGEEVVGKQGHLLAPGISAQSVGAQRIHLQIVRIPPGVRSKAHKHENHESAIYILSGESGCWYGDELQHHLVARAGDFLYIPANMPHLPAWLSSRAPIPTSQESVRLLPELEDLTHIDKLDLRRL